MNDRRHLTSAREYWLKRIAMAGLFMAVLAIVALGACRRGVPVFDPGERPATTDGTISGTVRGSEGSAAIEGRVVEVVHVSSGERQRTLTNSAGGFTFKVKPGKYRVELPLRDGEKLVKRPGTLDVNRSDVDAYADFVLGSAPISRPRSPAYRVDDGLGSPVA